MLPRKLSIKRYPSVCIGIGLIGGGVVLSLPLFLRSVCGVFNKLSYCFLLLILPLNQYFTFSGVFPDSAIVFTTGFHSVFTLKVFHATGNETSKFRASADYRRLAFIACVRYVKCRPNRTRKYFINLASCVPFHFRI